MSYQVKDVLISIEDVSLSYDGKPILRNINADVRDIVRPDRVQGQVVGILGPSGIGKTQLSRIMSGLQRPTSGSVMIHEGDKKTPVQAGLVGVVAQNYPLLRHRTILGNLMIACTQAGMDPTAAREKSMDMLSRFELTDKATEYPSRLSGGQRQRVAIIQQLLCSEHFIIMDEPFTGLDPLMKDKTCDLINQVAAMDERNTIFVVAHDIPAVVSIADSMWLIGRDKDGSGNVIPGSCIQEKYDLAQMGLAWDPGLSTSSRFFQFVADVKARFRSL